MKYYSAIKGTELLSDETMWVSLNTIRLRHERQNNTYYDSIYIKIKNRQK